MATCQKNVERLDAFLQRGYGDPKTLKGESTDHRSHHITFITINHECSCMKLCRFVSASLIAVFGSTFFRLLLAAFGSVFDNLARAERSLRRFVGF